MAGAQSRRLSTPIRSTYPKFNGSLPNYSTYPRKGKPNSASCGPPPASSSRSVRCLLPQAPGSSMYLVGLWLEVEGKWRGTGQGRERVSGNAEQTVDNMTFLAIMRRGQQDKSYTGVYLMEAPFAADSVLFEGLSALTPILAPCADHIHLGV